MKMLETNIENTCFTNEKFCIDYFDYGHKFFILWLEAVNFMLEILWWREVGFKFDLVESSSSSQNFSHFEQNRAAQLQKIKKGRVHQAKINITKEYM